MAKHETTVKLKAKDETGKAFNSFNRNAKEATKLTKAFSRGMDSAIQVGAKLGLAMTAAGAGVLAMGVGAVSTVRELKGLASATDLSINDLRAYGAATKTVGVTLEQFADINKDVNDKLGEFKATGGGGFKDFFDRLPAAIRPSVDELSRLAGPDVLIAVKKAMDDANVSGKEQTFILESIGNDASKLKPLLEGAGEGLNKLAKGFKDTNAELTPDDIKNIEAYGRAISKIGAGAESASLKTSSALGQFADAIADQITEMSGASADAFGDVFGFNEMNAAINAAEKFSAELNKGAKISEKKLNPELEMAARHVKRAESQGLADELETAALQAKAFAEAFDIASDRTDTIASNLAGIQGLGEERDQKPATVLGALTKSSKARGELQKGNVEKASELALEAAQELRQVEEDTGKNVTLAGTFIKNFEKIAQDALNKAEEQTEALRLVIVVDGKEQSFAATPEGAKKAGDDTTKRLKAAEKKRA